MTRTKQGKGVQRGSRIPQTHPFQIGPLSRTLCFLSVLVRAVCKRRLKVWFFQIKTSKLRKLSHMNGPLISGRGTGGGSRGAGSPPSAPDG